jgi:tRNA nucleotidyltransferase/poly(A) polymerase
MRRGHTRRGSKGRRESAFSFLGVLREDPVIRRIHVLSAETRVRAYLVGGVMRNAALGLPLPFDYDLAVEGDLKGFSERLAGDLGGSCFLLDEVSETWRVVKKKAYTIDAAPVKGGDISTDLAMRDFTVNALAVSVDELFGPGEPVIIDPLGGMGDVEAKLLRAAYDKAFDDDPLRTLRAVRISQQHGLKITEEPEELVKDKAPLLAGTARERISDELLLIFGSPGTARSIKKLFNLGMVETILPGSSGWVDVDGYNLLDHTLKTLDEAEAFLTGPVPLRFAELKKHFDGYVGNVRRAAVLKLGAFFHDAGKPSTMRREDDVLSFMGHDMEGEEITKKILRRLRVGRKVTGEVQKLVRNHHRPFILASLKEPSRRAMVHFFNAAGGETVLGLLALALADARATRGGEDEELRTLVERMLSFYYDTYRKKVQKPLLGGKEIMETFGIPEGVLVGEIMREVAEAVERGVVRSKKGAVKHISGWLAGKDSNKGGVNHGA